MGLDASGLPLTAARRTLDINIGVCPARLWCRGDHSSAPGITVTLAKKLSVENDAHRLGLTHGRIRTSDNRSAVVVAIGGYLRSNLLSYVRHIEHLPICAN